MSLNTERFTIKSVLLGKESNLFLKYTKRKERKDIERNREKGDGTENERKSVFVCVRKRERESEQTGECVYVGYREIDLN